MFSSIYNVFVSEFHPLLADLFCFIVFHCLGRGNCFAISISQVLLNCSHFHHLVWNKMLSC